MATRVKRASATQKTRDEAREEPRATPAGASPKRGATVALRVAPTAGGHDSALVHAEPREPAPAPRPRKPSAVRKQFAELRDALAGGWEIVQPVFARPLWSSADDSLTAFSFVLRRESATRLVTVPGGRLVEKFIAAQRLAVDERR